MNRNEVYESALRYFNGDGLAAEVWVDKYCLKDQSGNYYENTPIDMFNRLSSEFSRIENKYPNPVDEGEIYELLKDFKYIIPGGSGLAGIGNNHLLTSLSNCFVVDSPYDSYPGIMKTEDELVSIMKRRGGVGLSIGSLRSKNMPTTSVSEKSSGVVLFSERYSRATREVAQDGRRGALMISLPVSHPDVMNFIEAKVDKKMITGANVSVMIDDKFMKAVIDDTDYELLFTNEKGEARETVKAKDIWNKIIFNAWKSAEPGVLFWDTILRESPADCYSKFGFKTTSTNPCGEIPLSPGDSCRLMCLNLFSYVVNPFQNDCYFDYVLFKKHARIAQRLMDDLIDLEIEKINNIIIKIENDNDPEELKVRELKLWNNILDRAIKGRRTGLGITAEGDMIAALGLRYASDEAIELSVEVHKTLAIESYKSSIELAKERDSFVVWDRDLEKNNPFLGRIISELLCENGPCSYMREDTPMSDYLKYGRRNIANLTIAPTGSLSILTGTTSGVEPLFLPYYNRKKKTNIKGEKTIIDDQGDMWEEFKIIHSKFKMWYDLNWFKLDIKSFDIDFKKDLSDMNEKELNEVFKKSPYYKSTSNDIDWVNKVKMQGEIQKWVDHSISVTVNLPKETEVSVVDKLYMTAYLSGCKGMTVYRDGCRDGVLSSGNKQKGELNYTDAPKRPSKLECDIYSKTALGKDFTIIVGLMEDKPFEIFAFSQIHQVDFPKEIKIGTLQKLKSGVYKLSGFKGDKEYFIDNIITLMDDNESTNTRRYSLKLRHGIDPIHITDQIDKYANITSFDKVIGRVLKNYLNGKKTKSLCPDCNSNLVMQDGCEKCLNCGYSKCG